MVRCLLPSLSTRPLSEPSRESKSCECGVEIGGEEGLKWTILLFVCLCLLCLFINLFVSRIIIVIITHDGVFFLCVTCRSMRRGSFPPAYDLHSS